MDEETSDLIQQLVTMVLETQLEVTALRELLIDHELVSQREMDARIEEARRENELELRSEVLRRAYAKQLEHRPKQ